MALSSLAQEGIMHNKWFRPLFIFTLSTTTNAQTFSTHNVTKIPIPGKHIERPQFSRDGNWLSLETIHQDGFEVYIFNLNKQSKILPVRKKLNSTRNLNARRVKWSPTDDEMCYLIGKDQIGLWHFYELDLNNFSANKPFLEDLCKKIFKKHDVRIQSYAININYDKDYFLFATTEKKLNETRISIFTSYLESFPEPYKGGVSLYHFAVTANNQLAFARENKNNKTPKIVIFEDDFEQDSEIAGNRTGSLSAEIGPQFSRNNPEKYVAFLAKEKSESKDWYLWLLIDPFSESAKLQKIDGPVVIRDDAISLNDLNFAWHPNHDIIFYILQSEDGSNPIYYYNMNSGQKRKLVTNTERNMYIDISKSGQKIVFGSQGKKDSDKPEYYTRKAYVADLIIKK